MIITQSRPAANVICHPASRHLCVSPARGKGVFVFWNVLFYIEDSSDARTTRRSALCAALVVKFIMSSKVLGVCVVAGDSVSVGVICVQILHAGEVFANILILTTLVMSAEHLFYSHPATSQTDPLYCTAIV